MERNWNNVDPDGITDQNSGISGIVYPIPEPQMDDVFGGEIFHCDGFPEECPYHEQFWRQDGVPGTLVPPNWIAHSDFVNPGDDDWRYYCPACKLQNDRSVDLLVTAGQMEDAEDLKLVHRGQNSNEAGTGSSSTHFHQQPPQESLGNYLARRADEAYNNLRSLVNDFRRQQGRRENDVELDAMEKQTGWIDAEEEQARYYRDTKRILRELNILIPAREDNEGMGDYITRLDNLIPREYSLKKPGTGDRRLRLMAEAKKIYGKKPELLRLALKEIYKEERRKRGDAATLREMDGNYYSDNDNNDGASSRPRKKSKKTTEFKGPEGKFSLGKKTKKKGGRRKKRTRRRRKKRRKPKGRKRRRKKRTKRRR